MSSVIDARLAVVFNSRFVERDGAFWIPQIEWMVLQIFTRHFARVALVCPQIGPAPDQKTWVALPGSISMRDSGLGSARARAGLNAGLSPAGLAARVEDADVLFGRLPGFAAYHAIRLGNRTGRHTMASMHGDWAESYRADWSKGWRRPLGSLMAARAERMFRRVGRDVDQLFSVGQVFRDRYASQRSDATIFANYIIRPEDLLERADACAEPPYRVLFVGSLSARKGVRFLIDAIAKVRERGTDVRLTLVGDGPGRAEYTQQVQRLGIEDVVDFEGYVDMGEKLLGYYARHDLSVLPSLGAEGCPKVIVESMAKSCPVIATPVGSVPYMITDRENGLLVPPGEVDPLVGAIESIIGDESLRRTMVRGGLAYAAENTYEKQTQRVGDALRAALVPKFGEVNL